MCASEFAGWKNKHLVIKNEKYFSGCIDFVLLHLNGYIPRTILVETFDRNSPCKHSFKPYLTKPLVW